LGSGIFSAYHCQGDAFRSVQSGHAVNEAGDLELEMTMAMSRSENDSVEDQILKHILSESLNQKVDPNEDEESDIQRAMQNSTNDEARRKELDDQLLQAAIAASLKPDFDYVIKDKPSKFNSDAEGFIQHAPSQHIVTELDSKTSCGAAIVISDSDGDQPNA